MISGETIVALSSGRLPAGVAVIRISGPRTRFAFETICGSLAIPRQAAFRTFRSAKGEILDRGLALFFAAPHSFTGEDTAEFQVHGGRAVVAALLRELTGMEGIRHAEAGEFTRRAFLNGKLDLVQTEALADLIEADTEAQRRFAQRNADGAQSALYEGWRQRLIHARAMIEAEIDFADEGDVPGSVAATVWADMAALAGEIAAHIKGFSAAEMIREGFRLAILGAPNAGKSSLFNYLAQREAAIVTDEPGTTRDVLEVVLDIDGIKVVIADTAGLREAAGKIEAIGIEKAKAQGRGADLALILEDLAAPREMDIGWLATDRILVGTKLDLVEGEQAQGPHEFRISTRTGDGIENLLDEIRRRVQKRMDMEGDVLPSRLRHVELLEDTLDHLSAALDIANPLELRAEDLRLAADRLGRIIGAVDVEDLLDVIFSQFCIGK